jgi:16S rRNA (cytidine1402-2'-O)-methyltransferase
VSALYIIATPIGNLEDISLRALRLLGQVKLIAAEDTRTTHNLLKAYNIKTKVTSYYEHNKITKLDYILNSLQEGDVALVSDAGMPGLSDTGYELVSAAINRGFSVVPIPGASAPITALVSSGLPTDQFMYLGFLPRRKADRQRLLLSISSETRTLVSFEAPHRLLAALRDILNILGDRHIAVCRELTKIHEEIFRGTISQAISHFTRPKGEFTLVMQGCEIKKPEINISIEDTLNELFKDGLTAKEAVSQLHDSSGVPKKKLYQAWLKLIKGERLCDVDA